MALIRALASENISAPRTQPPPVRFLFTTLRHGKLKPFRVQRGVLSICWNSGTGAASRISAEEARAGSRSGLGGWGETGRPREHLLRPLRQGLPGQRVARWHGR